MTVVCGFHLAFVDRPGNRRLDSFRNILQHPRVGMLFLVPGMRECVRVNGIATLLRDPSFADGPGIGVRVRVEEQFVHCGQALRRSSLWDRDGWPGDDLVPTPADLIASQKRHRPGAPSTHRHASQPGATWTDRPVRP